MLVFAHRGARSLSWENTVRAFRLGLRNGAVGLESDVRVTADGVPVLAHGARTITGVTIARRTRARLPRWVPSLADLYEGCGTDYELSLDVRDDAAIPAVLAVAGDYDATHRLWLVTESWEAAVQWRTTHGDGFRLAHSVPQLPDDLPAHATRLAAGGIDVLNAPARCWTADTVETCHDAELMAFGWRVLSRRTRRRAEQVGLDGIYTDWPWLLAAATDGQPVRATT